MFSAILPEWPPVQVLKGAPMAMSLPLCARQPRRQSGRPHVVDGYGALSVWQIVVIISLEPLAGRPVIAADLPLAMLEHALKAVDWPTVLEPLDSSGTALYPFWAGRPCHGILRVGMPIPQSATCLRIRSQLPSWHGAVQLISSESALISRPSPPSRPALRHRAQVHQGQ